MTLNQYAALLESVPGFAGRVAMNAFPEGQVPDLPYIVYRQTGENRVTADNRVYYSAPVVDTELYTEVKSPDAETALESALASAELIWVKDEDYLDSERCFMVTYTVTL